MREAEEEEEEEEVKYEEQVQIGSYGTRHVP
jgi:hypothetical protein